MIETELWQYPKILSPEREEVYTVVESQVGNTPLYEITHIPIPNGNRVFAKVEYVNPTGSNFDRVYPYLFKLAESEGLAVPGVTPTIEVTTGNAGAAFAWTAQRLGFGTTDGNEPMSLWDNVIMSLGLENRLSRRGIKNPDGSKMFLTYELYPALMLDPEKAVPDPRIEKFKGGRTYHRLLADPQYWTHYPFDEETHEYLKAGILPLNKPIVGIHADAPQARIDQIRSYGARVMFSPSGDYTAGYVKLLEILLALDGWHDELLRKERLPLGKSPRRLLAMTKILPTARDPYAKLVDEAESQLQELARPDSTFDFSISVVGSGDFISGTGKRLKERNPDAKIIAVEPAESPGLSSLREGKVLRQERMNHQMYGAIPFNLPANKLNIDFRVIDEIEQVSAEEWQEAEKRLHQQEGQLVGRSSSAELAVALRLAQQVRDSNILITFHDPAWKYTDTYVPVGYKA